MSSIRLGVAPIFMLSLYLCLINSDHYETLNLSSLGPYLFSQVVFFSRATPNDYYKTEGSPNFHAVPRALPNQFRSL